MNFPVKISNTHDCVGAIFILQFSESLGGILLWVHFDTFKSDNLGGKHLLSAVSNGGPKAHGPRIPSEFYRPDIYVLVIA